MALGKVNVRASLRSSFKDGVFAALMGGVIDHYATPLALFLGATVQQVGFITALPNLLSSLSQFFAVRVIYWVGGRLKLLVRLVFSQASLILCIAILPWLQLSQRVELLLVLLILAALCGGLAGPAWGSLMSDYIPATQNQRRLGTLPKARQKHCHGAFARSGPRGKFPSTSFFSVWSVFVRSSDRHRIEPNGYPVFRGLVTRSTTSSTRELLSSPRVPSHPNREICSRFGALSKKSGWQDELE
jgi:hypothetical protein